MENEQVIECPNLIKKRSGDEIYYWCTESDKQCLKEYGYECEVYNKMLDEEHDNNVRAK